MLAAIISTAILAAQPVRLAAPQLSTRGVEQKEADFLLDTLAQELNADGVTVTTAADIQAILGMERQRQLLGCQEAQGSCLAELASALGVDGVVRGSVGVFGGTYVLNLKVLKATDGTELAAASGNATGDRELLAELKRLAAALRSQLLSKLRPGERPPPQVSTTTAGAAESSARWVAVLPLGLGVAAGAVGGVLLGSAEAKAQALMRGDVQAVTPPAEAFAEQARGERGAGVALVVVGAAATVGAVVLFAALGPKAVKPTVAVAPGLATFGLAGELP